MKRLKGMIAALSGGILWGLSGVVSQFLFSRYGLDAEWLTAVRMTLSGLFLTGYCCIFYRGDLCGILTSKKEFAELAVFAVFGLLFCQLAYLKAIFYSNAATATILQYLGPVLIMGISCVRNRRMPGRTEWLCAVLAVSGTFLLATGGKIDTMVLTVSGLLWGILSAVGMTCYSLLPEKLMKRRGNVPVSGLGMLIGGLVMCGYSRIWRTEIVLDRNGWIAVGTVCFLGTVFAYTLYLYGVKEAGAVKAGLLACTEPMSSVFFMFFWLGVPLRSSDWIGFLVILATVFLSAKIKRRPEGNSCEEKTYYKTES